MKKSFQRKRSFLHVKSFVYSCFIVFALVGFYGMYFFQQSNPLESQDIAFNQPSNNVAQADFIAKIVDFDGTFYIEQNGKMLQTSNINDGDIVTLKDNAQIVFNINDGTKAKIIWPAKFVLSKGWENNFKLKILYGDFVEMSSVQDKNIHNIQVSVDDILVTQWEKTKPLDFQLLKEGKNRIIKNNGANLIVSTEDKNKTNVGKKQVLAVQGNDISLFDSFEKFAKAVKNNNLSQTFTLSDPAKLPWGWTADIQEIKALDPNEILNIKEETNNLPKEINTSLDIPSNEQKIASLEQTKTIDSQLDKQFLSDNLQELFIGYLQGREDLFKKAYNELENRISEISKSFVFEYVSIKGTEKEKITHLKKAAEDAQKYISNNYLLPPKYLDGIKKISQWMTYLETKKYWELSQKSQEDILTIISNNF